MACTARIIGRPSYWIQTAWPDGGCYLEQDSMLVECFNVIESEAMQIEVERARS